MSYRWLLLATLLAAPAMAQDGSEAVVQRSPASAQRLFAMLLPSKVVVKNKATQIWSPNRVPVRIDPSPDGCTSIYALNPNDTASAEPAEQVRLDWSAVEYLVAAQGSSDDLPYLITVETTGAAAHFFQISFRASDTRDRVMAAAKYLRETCDKAASTGF